MFKKLHKFLGKNKSRILHNRTRLNYLIADFKQENDEMTAVLIEAREAIAEQLKLIEFNGTMINSLLNIVEGEVDRTDA